MKNHIIGFAIFSLIIGSAVFIDSLFSAPQTTVPAVADYEDYSPAKNSCWRMKRKIVVQTNVETSVSQTEKKVTYELQNVEYDTVNGVLSGQVELSWNGEGKRPNAVVISLNLFSTDNPAEKISFGNKMFLAPFNEGDTVNQSFAVKIGNENLIDTKANYYSYADLSVIQNFEEKDGLQNGRQTRILLDVDEKLAQASPVTMIHGK